jgi:hypothetical protein
LKRSSLKCLRLGWWAWKRLMRNKRKPRALIGPVLYSVIIFVFRLLCTNGLFDFNWRHAGHSERFFPQSEAKEPYSQGKMPNRLEHEIRQRRTKMSPNILGV